MNPIIEVVAKHRNLLGSSSHEENKKIMEEAASKMVARLAWSLGDENDTAEEQRRNNNRAKWLAYNLLLDICDTK